MSTHFGHVLSSNDELNSRHLINKRWKSHCICVDYLERVSAHSTLGWVGRICRHEFVFRPRLVKVYLIAEVIDSVRYNLNRLRAFHSHLKRVV